MLFVFAMSAVLHEYMVSVPLRMFKAYAFFGMALQVFIVFFILFFYLSCVINNNAFLDSLRMDTIRE